MSTFDQIKVFVWNDQLGFKNPGHASMALYSNDGDFVYISFWPHESKNRDKRARKSNSRQTLSTMMSRYEDDKEEIGRDANRVFFKNNIESATKYSLSAYKNIWKEENWSLYGVNCCHVVISNLGFIYGEDFAFQTKLLKPFGLFKPKMAVMIEALFDEDSPSNPTEMISKNLPILNTRDVIKIVKRLNFIEI